MIQSDRVNGCLKIGILIYDVKTFLAQSSPIQSDPIRSIPIQSDPIQCNAIGSASSLERKMLVINRVRVDGVKGGIGQRINRAGLKKKLDSI